jgi:hypothetical protein
MVRQLQCVSPAPFADLGELCQRAGSQTAKPGSSSTLWEVPPCRARMGPKVTFAACFLNQREAPTEASTQNGEKVP